MYSLFGALIRTFSGDGFRKATPRESQCFSAALALIGVYFALISVLMKHDTRFFDILDSLGPLGLAALWILLIPALFFIGRFWGRHVPAKASYVLAAILWPTLFILALTGHLGP